MIVNRGRVVVKAVSMLIVVLSLVFAGSALAQVASGTLTGTITDAKGAAMAGVTVTVHNQDTGKDTPAVTNDSGIFTAPLLPPGNYDVTAAQAGFATVQRKGALIQVGQTVRIDLEMPVASQQSLITVTTEVPVLETEKTDQAQNVSENLVSNLPVSSRSWAQLVLLTPGVTPDGNNGSLSFHGLNSLYNNYSVDGANNNNSYNGAIRGGAGDQYSYSPDAIQEFQVSANSFTAEVGQATGGAVNATTKSGTNGFHGDVFENFRNPIFNALDPVTAANAHVNSQLSTQPVHQQNQFGASIGGPIIKDKLFFFANYDGYWKVQPAFVTTVQVNPPIGQLACPSATYITAAQCTDAKNYVLTNVIGTFPSFFRQDIELLKFDYQLNSSNHISGVANVRDYRKPSSGGGSNLSGATENFLQDRFIIGTWTSVISNSKVNELRYQWGVDLSFSPAANIGGAPSSALSQLFTYGSNNGSTFTREPRNQVSDNFSFTHGKHSFKTGVDLNFITDSVRSSVNSAGLYSYSSAVALTPAVGFPAVGCPASGSGAIFCDWLVDFYGVDVHDGKTRKHYSTYTQIIDTRGVSYQFAPGFAAPDGRVAPQTFKEVMSASEESAYFQDTWKVRPNLTLNLGLRYDVELFPPPPYPNNSTPFLTSFTAKFPSDYSGIQPRVGVAWNFARNTVLRAGGGLFYAKTSISVFKTIVNGGDNAQVNCTPANCPGGLAFPNVLFNVQDIPLQAPFHAADLSAAQQPVTPVATNPIVSPCPCGNRGIDPADQRPRAYEFEGGVERQLPGSMSVSLNYQFTRGTQLPYTNDANIAPTALTKTYDVVNTAGITTLTSTVPFYTKRIDTTAGAVITQFGGVNSKYHAVIATFRKAPSHGIELLANYTFSKATDNGQQGQSGGETFFGTQGSIDPYNQKLEQGASSTDVPNRFTGSVVWHPEYGKNSNRLMRGLASGWTLSSAVTISNGTRYAGLVQSTASQSVPGGTGLNGGMSGADIQTTANSIGGRIAWLPNNFFELPTYSDVDLRLAKEFSLRERYRFAFRAEAFNLFNSDIIQAVNANAFTFAAPSASSAACWNGTANAAVPAGTTIHTNTCMTPVSTFQVPTTTSSTLLGARQLQFALRFEF